MICGVQMRVIFAGMANEEPTRAEQQAQAGRDTDMLRSAERYADFVQQADTQLKTWLSQVEPRHLSGAAESAYLKKLGHRPLTKKDFTSLVSIYGDEHQKQVLADFNQTQTELSQRLGGSSNLGLVLKQAGINYNTYYLRVKRPALWQPEEIMAVVRVLERLKL